MPPVRPAFRRLFQVLAFLGILAAGRTLPGQVQTYRHFDERDGLPKSQVSCLLEDRQGFLWVGTSEGVGRLGASGFQTFGALQGLKALDVATLFQDRDGSLWVGGYEGGADRIRGSRVDHFGETQGLAAPSVYCFMEDRSGALLAGTRSGLFRRRGNRFEPVELPGGWSHQPIFAMAQDPSGGIWLGSSANQLARWDGRQLVPANLPGPMMSRFRGLQTDASGRVWALSAEALYALGEKGVWHRDPLPGLSRAARFSSFQVTRDGELLLAMDVDGAYVRTPGGDGRVITYQDGISREGVSSVLRDGRGDLWLGTNGAGLLAEPVPGLLGLDRDPRTGMGLGLGMVLAFAEDGPDRMLIGSTTGLHLWQRGRGIVGNWDAAKGVRGNSVWALAPRKAGGFWVATLKGLVVWSGGRIVPGPRELDNVAVSNLLLWKERLWVSTLDRGLVELDSQGRFVACHPAPPDVGEPAILDLAPWGDGLLAATRNGVYRFREGAFQPVLRQSPVGTSAISCLFTGGQGDLWVGTASNGAFQFPRGLDGPCRAFGEAGARIRGRVGWIAQAGSGDVVIGHGHGLTVLRASGGGVRPLPITRNLGLLSNETSDSGVIRDHLGRLWIGMQGGFCVLDAASDLPDPALPKPRILEVAAGSTDVLPGRAVVLPPNPGALTLRFDMAKPILAEAPSYQVWVDGAWRDVEPGGNLFRIARLAPGVYPVRVRASTGQGWTESDTVMIRIRAAWYQTLAARIAFLLAFAALAAQLINARLRVLGRRARMLEAKVAERTRELTLRNRSLERMHHQLKRSFEGRIQLMNSISHDLRSPLTTILLSVGLLEERDELSEKSRGALRVLASEAQRVEHLIKSLLDGARAQNMAEGLHLRLCHPGEVLQGLPDTLRIKAEARGLAAHFEDCGHEDTPWILADAESMQQVLFNLVENALKFTEPPGDIGIRSRMAGDAWVFEVWDTGRGIETGQASAIFEPFQQSRETDAGQGWGLGLSICQMLVAAHEGGIEVESEPGKGSVFRVTLPLVTEGVPAGAGSGRVGSLEFNPRASRTLE